MKKKNSKKKNINNIVSCALKPKILFVFRIVFEYGIT